MQIMERVKIEGEEREGVMKRVSCHAHIDMLHRSSMYWTQYRSNLEVGYSRFSPFFVFVPDKKLLKYLVQW